MWCPNGHTSTYEPWDWLVWAIDLSQPTLVVWGLDQMSPHVVTFWVLSLEFWIKVFGDKHHWLLSPCCYTSSKWAVPTCNKQNLGAIPSRLDGQKHLDDLLHSAGKASPFLSGWGLSYSDSQRTYGRLLELDIPKIEMGTAVVINNLGSILNNTTANIDIALTRWTFFLADWHIYASRIVPASSTKFHYNFTKVMDMVKKYKEDISIIYMNQDLRCVLWCPHCQNTSQVLVCGNDADVFILPFHHAHRLCDVIMELDISGREQLEMHKYQWADKKHRPTSEWDISICCTVVQNWPNVVENLQ